ncbi:MAG: sigma-54 dependent transcriptional regulator [Rubrivivax sp.]
MNPTAAYRLLVVDDEPDLRTLYELTLVREGYDVDCAGSVEEAWAALQAQRFAVVITDMRLPDGSGLDLLRRMDEHGRREKGIVITAYGSAENAVEALKAGAYDYLTKPVDLRQFRSVVATALGRAPAPVGEPPGPTPRERDAGHDARGARAAPIEPAPPAAAALRRLAGQSAAMQQVRSLVERVARGMAPVLVQGESGTGKELVARAIHEVSPRAGQHFIAVNCGAIPEALLEAEFFGYRKGAFTGATEDRQGFFQAAHGGTLFLDEIGEMPLSMQSKLLRVIQERAVRPVGSTAELPVNVRIVSATHKDLAAEVAAGRFRQDLFYRLNVIQIPVPPLRERLQDLAEICQAVIERIAGDAGVTPVPELTAGAMAQLRRYAFPGNVRELENLLHRALALSGGARIEREDLALPDDLLHEAEAEPAGAPAAPVPAPAPSGQPPLPSDLAAHLDQVEREILERALERHRYNRTAAGASLGLSLRQMRYRMARLGIGGSDIAAERGDAP